MRLIVYHFPVNYLMRKDEAITVITSDIIEYMDVAGEFDYEKKR